MTTPYTHSGYERREHDHYPTIDERCTHGLVETWKIGGVIVDPCAPDGSGIVDELVLLGHDARCATHPVACDWLVTNPPYSRPLVNRIAEGMLRAVESASVHGMAMLVRATWGFAVERTALFASPLYRGETKLRFRPEWFDDGTANPIHPFVWHVWTPGEGEPVIRLWTPSGPRRGAAGRRRRAHNGAMRELNPPALPLFATAT